MMPYGRILMLALLVVACDPTSERRKGTLIIIGGGSRPDAIIERIILESGLKQGGYGVVLPMASTSDSSAYFAAEPFRKSGIESLVGFAFRKGEVPAPARLDSVRNAKLIYITGGDQNRFMDVVQETDIEIAIREAYTNGAVVAGTSAGAAVMCEKMTTGNQLRDTAYTSTFKTIESNNLEIKPGLGLLSGVLIDQHFLIRSRHNRLLTGVIDYPDHKGIGIDESTAIVVKDHTAEVIGNSQVVVVENPDRSRLEKGGKLGARGLVTNIYLAGDTFLLK
jgi:cyanophycinase